MLDEQREFPGIGDGADCLGEVIPAKVTAGQLQAPGLE